MSSEEENKHIRQHDLDALHRMRREKQLKALRHDERDGIAVALQTSEEVAQEALELGFDQQTARVLPLVPLIQVAWADGSVSGAEARTVLQVAERADIKEGSPPHNFLKLMLDKKPSDLFFDRVDQVIRRLIEQSGGQIGDRPPLRVVRRGGRSLRRLLRPDQQCQRQ